MIAIGLSSAFACSAGVLAYSITEGAEDHFIVVSSAYWGLDLLALLIVCGIFAASLDAAVQAAKGNGGGVNGSEKSGGWEKSSNHPNGKSGTASSRIGGSSQAPSSSRPMKLIDDDEPLTLNSARCSSFAPASPTITSTSPSQTTTKAAQSQSPLPEYYGISSILVYGKE